VTHNSILLALRSLIGLGNLNGLPIENQRSGVARESREQSADKPARNEAEADEGKDKDPDYEDENEDEDEKALEQTAAVPHD